MPFDNKPEPPAESETIRILVGAREWLSNRDNWCKNARFFGGQSCLLGAVERQVGIAPPMGFDRIFERKMYIEERNPDVVKALARFTKKTERDNELAPDTADGWEIRRKSWRIAMNNDIYGYEHVLGMLDKAIAYLRKREMFAKVKETAGGGQA